jgi:SAM-dependent methyltransferase
MQKAENYRCPRCRAPLAGEAPAKLRCSADDCALSQGDFPCAGGQPVLIDFAASIFAPDAYRDGRGSGPPRDDSGRGFAAHARALIWGGKNKVAPRIAADLAARLSGSRGRPKLLVIGGGALGVGVDRLSAGSIDVIGMDVYASANTRFIADAHAIPLPDASVDAVWIQAVLEHVLDPCVVADEIERVLKPGGFVYADTPFIQQVHEGAYDFTRFTLSGHRWLFRAFEEIESGPVGGAATALAQAIRYTFRAFGIGDKLATALTLPFFWLRFLDPLTRRRPNADAASGVYFFGQKTGRGVSARDMIDYYDAQTARPARLRNRPRRRAPAGLPRPATT